jgi:hypothetical protein
VSLHASDFRHEDNKLFEHFTAKLLEMCLVECKLAYTLGEHEIVAHAKREQSKLGSDQEEPILYIYTRSTGHSQIHLPV